MNEIYKAIEHFEHLQKRHTTTHNGKHCEIVKTALAALRAEEEREKGCEWCSEFEDLPEHFENGVAVGKVFDTCIQPDEKGRWHIELPRGADIGIRFCPMCGKRLEKRHEDD